MRIWINRGGGYSLGFLGIGRKSDFRFQSLKLREKSHSEDVMCSDFRFSAYFSRFLAFCGEKFSADFFRWIPPLGIWRFEKCEKITTTLGWIFFWEVWGVWGWFGCSFGMSMMWMNFSMQGFFGFALLVILSLCKHLHTLRIGTKSMHFSLFKNDGFSILISCWAKVSKICFYEKFLNCI